MLHNKTLQGRYRIYEKLSGGSGPSAVFLARDTGTGRMVVIKVLYSKMVVERLVARFLREVAVLQRIQSPNIVEIYDFSINHAQPDINEPISFIAMEYVEGLTLRTIIQRLGLLSPSNAVALARQIANGLDEIHNQHVIHRDLKSQNIMITADNTAKIIDFGIAKQLSSESGESLTGQFSFAGTLSYAAPEQLRDSRNVDIRADLYALGVVTAECLLGKIPSRNRLGQHIMIQSPPPDTEALHAVTEAPKNLNDILQRLLQVDPEDRFPTPRALIEVLDSTFPDAQLRLPWGVLGQRAATLGSDRRDERVQSNAWLMTARADRIPINRTEFSIGRSAPGDESWAPDLDVRAMGLENAKTVSRFHCRILIDDDQTCRLMDMGSFNGTWLNNQKLEPRKSHPLKNNDQINLGGVQLTYHANTPDQSSD